MNQNKISLVSVSDLFGKRFFIPDYQRGYRWSDKQVTDLLSDIYEFAKDKNKGNTYCLQPLVVKEFEATTENNPHSLEHGTWYEVIDGQQRLTTIKILFSYFVQQRLIPAEAYKGSEIVLEYETRANTGRYLSALAEQGVQNPFREDNRDIEHISKAYQTMEHWFLKFSMRAKSEMSKIMDTLISLPDGEEAGGERLVKFIFFEVDKNTNAIEAFERINIGKIALTNAELIKALFLQKSNFLEQAQLRKQIEIADAWDQIEYALQDDRFWCFLNKEINNTPSRIEFIFDFIYRMHNDRYPTQKDEYETFRYFSDRLSNATAANGNFGKVTMLWKEVKKYYSVFREWYLDHEMFHYVGFLITQGKIDIVDIYSMYQDVTKDEFRKVLIDKIKNEIEISYSVVQDSQSGRRTYLIDMSYDKTSKAQLRMFFLLLNIQTIIRNRRSQEDNAPLDSLQLRFSFDAFKKERWDIEHIDSYTENTITKTADQQKWIETALSEMTAEEQAQYLQKAEQATSFEHRKEIIQQIIGETTEEAEKELKNSVGNLTLLDAGTNRSYGNALFPTKRKKIILRDAEGKFVLPCTKAVFFKYYNENCATLRKWEKQDIQMYTNYIGAIMEPFMKKEGE